MTVPQSLDRKTFLANLRQSKLLSETQLVELAREMPEARPLDVARSLIKKEVLTQFQAERLLAGRNTGFILGPYRILDELGRGGMGRVFKAEHQTMKRQVALKVLAPKLLESERARMLFLREVQAAAQIIHPNVVAAFDAGEVEGHYFLVLEYVDGPTLEQMVRKQGPLSLGLACDYIKQTANGLQAAHALGMVHRDIKPSNLLVQRWGLPKDSPGLIKISDFGLARLNAPLGGMAGADGAGTILIKQNTVMGTPDFLSPEQARNLHGADIRSDLYSLGCTFYYLLTGEVPFPGGTAVDKLIRHSAEQPAALTDCRSDLPQEVIDIVGRLMFKIPDRRYQSPRELAEVLEPYAVSGPIPWSTTSSSTLDTDTSVPTSERPVSSSNILEANTFNEWSTLASTSSPDSGPTVLPGTIRPPSIPPSFSLSPITLLACLVGAAITLLVGLAVILALLH